MSTLALPSTADAMAWASLGTPTPQASSTIQAAPVVPVLVTRDDPGLPASCSPQEVANLIMRFFEAVNQGQIDQVGRFFSLDAGPKDLSPGAWYSVAEIIPGGIGGSFTAYKQAELLAYFTRRQA